MFKLLHDSGFATPIRLGILSLFAFGALGMVFMDVGGFFRNGSLSNTVAKVGNRSISLQEFDKAASGYLREQGMTVKSAYAAGLAEPLLAGITGREVLLQLAAKSGLVVDKQTIGKQIAQLLRPQMLGGETAKDALNRLLQAQGMSEAQFTEALRGDLTLNLLNQAVAGAAQTTPQLLAKALARGESERRDIAFVTINNQNAGTPPVADDATLKAYFETIKENYIQPETRQFQVLVFDTTKISATQAVTDEALQAEYKQNTERFAVPEQRKLVQCVEQTEESAKALIASGKLTGKTCQPAALFEKEGLPKELAEIVFKTEAGQIADQPVKSPFGWHVVQVVSVVPAGVKSFESVKDALKRDMAVEAQRTQTETLLSTLEKGLAEGIALEELAKLNPAFSLATLPAFDAVGTGLSDKTPLQKQVAANSDLRSALFELMDEETSDMQEVEDGVYAAFKLTATKEAAAEAFDVVKAKVAKAWQENAQQKKRADLVNKLAAELASNGYNMDEAAKKLGLKAQREKDLAPNMTELEFGNETTKTKLFRLPLKSAVETVEGTHETTLVVVEAVRVNAKAKSSITAAALNGLDNQLISDAVRAKATSVIGVKTFPKVLERAYGEEDAE